VSAIRVLVAGGGANIFSAHRRGLAAVGAQVVGLQDVNQERAKAVAAELGCALHPTLESLLAAEGDLVVVLAPHPSHADITVAALRAGKHVLTEKPIAVEVAEADRMIEEAARNRRVLAVAFQQRTRTEVREARRLIREGLLGEIQRADVIGTWPRRRTYFEQTAWRGTWRGEGGGVIVNQGQHDLDLLTHLAGRPAQVVGWTRTRIHRIEGDDTVEAIAEWPNGAVGSIHISTAEVDMSQRIELTGTRGRMRVLPGRLELEANGVDFRDFAATDGDPFGAVPAGDKRSLEGGGGDHADLYRDLAGALASGGRPIAPGDEAIVPLELANAIVLSSHQGRAVGLPVDRAAYSSLLTDLRGAAESRR
jgi:predicted dehydrogenase